MTDAERSLVRTMLWLCGACMVCLGLAEVLGHGTWPWEGIAALLRSAPPWVMATAPVFAVYLAWRHRVVTGPLVLTVVGLACTGRPAVFPPPDGALRLVSSNPQAYSEPTDAFLEALTALEADVLLQIEWRVREVPGLVRIADNYDTDLPKPSLGMGLYCREGLGCRGEVVGPLGAEGCGMPVGLLAVRGLCLVAVHAPPPVSYSACMDGRDAYLAALEAHLAEGTLSEDWGPCEAGVPTLVAGDLNAVVGSPGVDRLLARGLVDAQAGSGLYGATWPVGSGWRTSSGTYDSLLHQVIAHLFPLMRLDHVLAGPGMEVGDVHRVTLPEADHRSLVTHIRSAP